MKVLVTGADSQLALTIKDHIDYYKEIKNEYIFCNHKELDITNKESIKAAIEKYKPEIIINCAAYTNVEKAEDEFQKAIDVNCIGVENLVKACKENNIFLIHISTDYVYKSQNEGFISEYVPIALINESSELDPLSKYALSKYLGEKMCIKHNGVMIIRTSWLYSMYGKNFVKTIINKIKNNEEIKVVDDQYGRPTNADDLADFIIFAIIENHNYDLEKECEIFNFQNYGKCCSWYDFACAIYDFYTNKYAMPYSKHDCEGIIKRIKTSELNCKAERPYCTYMCTNKAIHIFNIPTWEMSLRYFIARMSK